MEYIIKIVDYLWTLLIYGLQAPPHDYGQKWGHCILPGLIMGEMLDG